MGCAPSSGTLHVTDENEISLIREIEHLKQQQLSQEEEIFRLRAENEKLRQEQHSGGHLSMDMLDSEDNHEVLVKEIEKLKLDRRARDQEISKLRETNKQMNQQILLHQQDPQPQAHLPSPAKPPGTHQKVKNLPKVGDPVLAMWERTPWQYFTATIVSFDPQVLKYTINWDDQDPSGRVVDYYNLALDRIPEPGEVAIGSIVLFPQGKYRGQEGVRLGGQRYHQGRITQVSEGMNGQKLFNGVHTKDDTDGKWITYSGYEPNFYELELSQLRISPNVLDILSAQEEADEEAAGLQDSGIIDPCEVFISYTKVNSPSAVRNQELFPDDAPPSYDEAVLSSICDPRDIRQQIEVCGVRVNDDSQRDSLIDTVRQINSAKVFVACLSDEYVKDEICRQEFQYAKKTVKKPVIPVVVGSGSFDWMMTVVGLLIAGEVYIHFKNRDVQDSKMAELLTAVRKNIPNISVPAGIGNVSDLQSVLSSAAAPRSLGPADVFISYCWVNSMMAYNDKQVSKAVGSSFADPRQVHLDLVRNGKFSLWIDTERLKTTSQNDESMGMFEQIAEGLAKAKVVLAFVSKQYANSENCRMEVQFALKSLKKPVVPVVVGEDDDWQNTVVGLLIASQANQPINLQRIQSGGDYQRKLHEIQQAVLPLLGYKEQTGTYRAPRPGDHVICHHQRWAYFPATIAHFDKESMSYTVDWDDGDPTGRVTSYKDLAIDEVPSVDQVGVDSIVFFSQGSYGATEGNNSGGMRFHQGVVTQVYKDHLGVTRYDGHHTKGEEDGKWITYKGYMYNFTGLALKDIKISPNAMDALMACKEAFLSST